MSKSLHSTTSSSRNVLLPSSSVPLAVAALGPYDASAAMGGRPKRGMSDGDLSQILEQALKISQDLNEMIVSGHSEMGVPTRRSSASSSPDEDNDHHRRAPSDGQ